MTGTDDGVGKCTVIYGNHCVLLSPSQPADLILFSSTIQYGRCSSGTCRSSCLLLKVLHCSFCQHRRDRCLDFQARSPLMHSPSRYTIHALVLLRSCFWCDQVKPIAPCTPAKSSLFGATMLMLPCSSAFRSQRALPVAFASVALGSSSHRMFWRQR